MASSSLFAYQKYDTDCFNVITRIFYFLLQTSREKKIGGRDDVTRVTYIAVSRKFRWVSVEAIMIFNTNSPVFCHPFAAVCV